MWQKRFKDLIPMLGHRNWILVVDGAYPLQSSAAMEVISTGDTLPSVLGEVMNEIGSAKHIRPIIYKDIELDVLSDELCPGVDQLKIEIHDKLAGFSVQDILHDDVFSKLDKASQLFSILVLKTDCCIPYSSIFIELDCGYWSANQEAQLRDKMR